MNIFFNLFPRPVRNIPLPPLVATHAKPLTLFVECERDERYHTWADAIMDGIVLSIDPSPFVDNEYWYFVALANGGLAHVPPRNIRIIGVQEIS